MSRTRLIHAFSLATMLVLAGSMSASAQTQPPQSQSVLFSIHANPSDPESPVVRTVELALSRVAVDGDSIGWIVKSVALTKVDPVNGNSVWTDDAPTVMSGDGLVWTEHANVLTPLISEFRTLPEIYGNAYSVSTETECAYTFTANEPAPPGSQIYSPTTELTYWVQESSDDPEDGDDVPVGTDPGNDDPI